MIDELFVKISTGQLIVKVYDHIGSSVIQMIVLIERYLLQKKHLIIICQKSDFPTHEMLTIDELQIKIFQKYDFDLMCKVNDEITTYYI